MSVFAQWQPVYAEHNIPTFPCKPDKRPAVTNYGRFGLPASKQIAMGSEANALGFMCGKRSRITVLDVDTTDERILADALDRHGKTSIISRTARGRFHALYRHNGERRWIRPRRDVPIDILGNGYVVAPPSRVDAGQYQLIQGSLDDLDGLPVMHNLAQGLSAAAIATDFANMREGDGRNTALFRQMMREAKQVDDYEQLLDRALTVNDTMEQPMEHQEVARIAGNVWGYTERGQNRFGQHGAWFPLDEVETFRANPDDFFLLGFLRAHNHPDSTFMVANGLAERFGWWRQRLVAARRRLIEGGYLKVVRQAGQQTPALYRWAR
jgi:hypothetical protein